MARAEPPGEVLAALSSPALYPGLTGRVTVRETHVSLVFLAGERAYKLKKPLVLPFLDYGTPQRRLRMCREEVRLNRRLAPDIYLGVRSIAAREGGFELAAEDDPRALDYLVEMRRYQERETLAARLASGELRGEELDPVARLLAAFHEQAPTARPREPVLALQRRWDENARELIALCPTAAEVARVVALERFAAAFTTAHADTIRARASAGRQREGHGDLRAEHVLLGETPQIVDCVEFSPAMRRLDVADELSFLVMDLTARGGGRFARRLVQGYREAGGDPGPDALIAFHAAYRAQVRAKVELLRAAQQPPGSSEHGRHGALARDLLGVAERFAWRARLPLAIVVCGLPASGKSALAREVAERCGLAHVSSDVTRKRLAGLAPSARGEQALYSPEWDRRTYSELGRAAAEQVAERGGAVIDATFRRAEDRASFRETFAAAAPLLFVECRAPLEVRARRAARREGEPRATSDASAELIGADTFAWEDLDEVAPARHVTLRSDRTVEAQLEDLLALLDGRLAEPA